MLSTLISDSQFTIGCKAFVLKSSSQRNQFDLIHCLRFANQTLTNGSSFIFSRGATWRTVDIEARSEHLTWREIRELSENKSTISAWYIVVKFYAYNPYLETFVTFIQDNLIHLKNLLLCKLFRCSSLNAVDIIRTTISNVGQNANLFKLIMKRPWYCPGSWI